MDQRVLQANASCYSYDWQINDQVFKKELLSLSDKMKPKWSGPYPVECIHVNGTCMIQLVPNITEWLNICQLKPFQGVSKIQAFFLSFNAVFDHCENLIIVGESELG